MGSMVSSLTSFTSPSDDAMVEAERPWPGTYFVSELRRVQGQIFDTICTGNCGTADEIDATLAAFGLAFDVVVGTGSASAPLSDNPHDAASLEHGNAPRSPRPADYTLTELRAMAKELQSLLMRYPLAYGMMGEVLLEDGLRWKDRPCRSTPGVLNRRLLRWRDSTMSLADSTLFTSSGIWVCPALEPLITLMSAMCIIVYGPFLVYNPSNAFFATGVLNGFLGFVAVALLRWGHVARAKQLFVAAGTFFIIGWGILTPALRLAGAFSPGCAFCGWGGGIIFYSFVAAPQFSFYYLWGALSMVYILTAIVIFAHIEATAMAGTFTFLTVVIWLARINASAAANDLVAADSNAYEAIWRAKLAAPHTADDLAVLRISWTEVMSTAARDGKVQPEMFGSIEVLFNACDRLHEVFLTKMRNVCDSNGGAFQHANVKSEVRALQKAVRSYGENWHRLTDINRCALVFVDFRQMATCLRAIAADPSIIVITMDDSKMRFDEGYDAATRSGGYRDIQLSVRIDTGWTRAQGFDQILCEVQLHVTEMWAHSQSTMGSAHRAYIQRRNMLGD